MCRRRFAWRSTSNRILPTGLPSPPTARRCDWRGLPAWLAIATGLARAEQTRMEQQPASFHRTVRDTFLQLANDDSRRVRLIDGARDKEAVARDVWAAVADLVE